MRNSLRPILPLRGLVRLKRLPREAANSAPHSVVKTWLNPYFWEICSSSNRSWDAMRKAGITGKNSLAGVRQELRMEYYKQPLLDLNYGFLVQCLLVQGSTNLISLSTWGLSRDAVSGEDTQDFTLYPALWCSAGSTAPAHSQGSIKQTSSTVLLSHPILAITPICGSVQQQEPWRRKKCWCFFPLQPPSMTSASNLNGSEANAINPEGGCWTPGLRQADPVPTEMVLQHSARWNQKNYFGEKKGRLASHTKKREKGDTFDIRTS